MNLVTLLFILTAQDARTLAHKQGHEVIYKKIKEEALKGGTFIWFPGGCSQYRFLVEKGYSLQKDPLCLSYSSNSCDCKVWW